MDQTSLALPQKRDAPVHRARECHGRVFQGHPAIEGFSEILCDFFFVPFLLSTNLGFSLLTSSGSCSESCSENLFSHGLFKPCFFQQFTHGVVSEGFFCGRFAEFLWKQ